MIIYILHILKKLCIKNYLYVYIYNDIIYYSINLCFLYNGVQMLNVFLTIQLLIARNLNSVKKKDCKDVKIHIKHCHKYQ